MRTLKSFLMLDFLSVLSTRSGRGIILYAEISTFYSPMFKGVWGGFSIITYRIYYPRKGRVSKICLTFAEVGAWERIKRWK